jgi:protein-S-isoprenylcysteine O-methyltransferase Ste14
MFVAKWEEKELTERFGKTYLDYKARVPFLIPRLRRKSGGAGPPISVPFA